jgi:hypothetical protein
MNTTKEIFSRHGMMPLYTWLKGNEGSQHCVWMAIILVNKEKIFLPKPNSLGGF